MSSLTHKPQSTLPGSLYREHKDAQANKGAQRRVSAARSVADGTELGTFANKVSKSNLKRRRSRARRFEARKRLREFTHLKRLKFCGRTAVDGAGVSIRCTSTAEGQRAGFAGLLTCGSVWACPVCAAKISAKRSEEISQVLKFAAEQGLNSAMMTFTVRHHQGDGLREVWDAVSKGWKRIVSGGEWRRHKQDFQIQGYLRATEVTHGSNGWHVHIHTIVIYGGAKENALKFGLDMWKRWESGISSAGFTAIRDSGGLDIKILEGGDTGALGRYLSKQADALAQEAALGMFKQGRKENRTPFQIAQMFAETGDEADLELWRQFEEASHGRKQLNFSVGLRAWAQIEPEKADEEIAAEETGSNIDDLVLLPGQTWKIVRSQSWKLLDIAEEHGKFGLVSWLEERNLEWCDPPSAVTPT